MKRVVQFQKTAGNFPRLPTDPRPQILATRVSNERVPWDNEWPYVWDEPHTRQGRSSDKLTPTPRWRGTGVRGVIL